MLSGSMNHALPSGSLTNLGLSDARRTLPAPIHSANYSLVEEKNGLGLFLLVQARPLIYSEGKS
jgi:hypothetical protein